MSTLVTQTIQSNTSTPPVFKNSSGTEKGRLIKKYINFDGTFGTSPFTEANGGIRDSFNVSSITDNGTGNYDVTFSISFPNADYCFLGSAGNGHNFPGHCTMRTKNNNNINIRTSGLNVSGGTHTDASQTSVVIFAD